MNIEAKIKRIGKSLKRARKSGNFRRIHKWENDLAHVQKRMCSWEPLIKRESLFRIKKRIEAIRFRSDHRFEDYKWDWCGLCRCAFVRCPHCGNNCCNAGHGWLRPDGTKPQNGDRIEDLVQCTICKTAYDIQELAYRLGKEPSRSSFPDADRIEEDFAKNVNATFDWLNDQNVNDPAAFNALFNSTPEELGSSAVRETQKSST
jgi:hypothetical protein